MVQQQTDSAPLQDTTVVDCDVHVSGTMHPEIAKDVIAHMDEPYSSYLDPDVDTFGSTSPGSGHVASIPGKVYGIRQSVTDPEAHVQKDLCEKFGVDYPILNMNALYDKSPDTGHIYQEMEAVNNTLLDRFLDDHDNFFGLATIAMRDPEKAAAEIDRIGNEDKIVGVYVHIGGQERGHGDPRYDPIYDAAQRHGLPMVFHSTGGALQYDAPNIWKGLEQYMSIHVLGHPWAMMWALTSLITQGTPEKFPDLDFVMLESGIGWVPYMMFRLNREYGQRRSEAPLLQSGPEDYIRDSFYFATQPLGEPNNPQHMRQIIDMVGADSIVFSTDHPHYDFDNPETIRGYLDHLTQEEQDKIFYKNAREIFDLPI